MERMWWEGRMVIDMSLRLGPYERLRDDRGALARLLRGGRRSRGRAARPTLRQLVFAPRPRSLRVRCALPCRHPDHDRPRLRVGVRLVDAYPDKRPERAGRCAARLEPRRRPRLFAHDSTAWVAPRVDSLRVARVLRCLGLECPRALIGR